MYTLNKFSVIYFFYGLNKYILVTTKFKTRVLVESNVLSMFQQEISKTGYRVMPRNQTSQVLSTSKFCLTSYPIIIVIENIH